MLKVALIPYVDERYSLYALSFLKIRKLQKGGVEL